MKVLLVVALFTISGVLSDTDSAVVSSSSSTGEGSSYKYAYNIHDPATGSVQSVQHQAVAGADAHEVVPVVHSPVENARQPKQGVLLLGEIFNAFNEAYSKPHNYKSVRTPIYPFFDSYAREAVPAPIPAAPYVPYPYSGYPYAYAYAAPAYNAAYGYAPQYVKYAY